MKPRIKKILIVLGTLVVLVISKRIYNTTNYDFNYLQKTNQTRRAQDVFWDRDIGDFSVDESTNAYDVHFSQPPGNIYIDFTLDLNGQYDATYFNKLGHNGVAEENPDDIIIIVSKKSETYGDKSTPFVNFRVLRKDFSIVDEAKYDDTNYEMTIPGMTIEERKDLMNLAIQRFKEAQDKYYSSKK